MHSQRLLVVPLLAIAASLLPATGATGHELNAEHLNVNYSNWINRAGKGCCNDQDCGPIGDSDVRLSPVTEVRIDGQWCPVQQHHYLRAGNAANWQTNHVCVHPYGDRSDPCSRLLCFQPKPLF